MTTPPFEPPSEVRFVLQERRLQVQFSQSSPIQSALDIPWALVHAALSNMETERMSADLCRALGAALYEALVPLEARGPLRDRWLRARDQGGRLRLRFHYQDPSHEALPLELMYSPEMDWLASSERVNLLRFPLSDRMALHRTLNQLRVLVLAPEPQRQRPLQWQAEAKAIEAELAAAPRGLHTRMKVLKGAEATREGLLRALSEGFDVLHVVTHGRWDHKREESVLLLHGDSQTELLGKDELQQTLRHHCPRVVILNTCDSGATGPQARRVHGHKDWVKAQRGAGLPLAALQAGALSVITMQSWILDRDGVQFASWLYQELVAGQPVEVALARARNALSILVRDQAHQLRMLAMPALHTVVAEGDRFCPTEEQP